MMSSPKLRITTKKTVRTVKRHDCDCMRFFEELDRWFFEYLNGYHCEVVEEESVVEEKNVIRKDEGQGLASLVVAGRCELRGMT